MEAALKDDLIRRNETDSRKETDSSNETKAVSYRTSVTFPFHKFDSKSNEFIQLVLSESSLADRSNNQI